MTLYPDGPCIEFSGRKSAAGYGVRAIGGTDRYEHRAVIERVGVDQFGTPFSPELVVMHLCDNRPCVKYDHLKLGTIADNNADMRAKGRHQHGETASAAKLTEAQVIGIRAMSAAGMSYSQIAAGLPINPGAVAKIVTRQRWKHVA